MPSFFIENLRLYFRAMTIIGGMNNLPDVIKVIVFSVMSYVTLFIIAKVLGKKQIAQLSFIDYVVGITIGSIAAEMATDTINPFYHYVVAMGIFLLFDLAVTLLSRKGTTMKNLLCGKPLIIIENGQINYEELKKSKLTVDELTGMARDKSYFDVNQIAFAILETSGKLSILPKAEEKPPVCKDLNITVAEPKLTEYLIIDGVIRRETLERNGYDEGWLKKGVGIKDEKSLSNILLASYDEEKKIFNVHYKSAL